jgi:acetyl esterase/lipase
MRLRGLLACLVVAGSVAAAGAAEAPYVRRGEVIYGREYGMALTLEVYAPRQNANGLGVVVLASGGCHSPMPSYPAVVLPELARRGYTSFVVTHGSRERYPIPEILHDLHRAVRYIRAYAKDYHIDPDRIGITGGSAGGHLACMQGTAGRPGDPKAEDTAERASSRVQAVSCFFPLTDFLNYGKPGEVDLGTGLLKSFKSAFDFQQYDPATGLFQRITDPERRRAIGWNISPVYHVSRDSAPTLIVHGDADPLVPFQQAETLIAKLKEAGVPAKLVTKHGAPHGWVHMDRDAPTIVGWFDEHLRKGEQVAYLNGCHPRPVNAYPAA